MEKPTVCTFYSFLYYEIEQAFIKKTRYLEIYLSPTDAYLKCDAYIKNDFIILQTF